MPTQLAETIQKRNARAIAFMNKFAIDNNSGAYVMKADAMSNRFTNEHTKEDVQIKVMSNDVIEDSQYGRRELAEDNRMLAQAHTLIRLGFKPPKKSVCVVYPDALERWITSRIKMMRGVLCTKPNIEEMDMQRAGTVL